MLQDLVKPYFHSLKKTMKLLKPKWRKRYNRNSQPRLARNKTRRRMMKRRKNELMVEIRMIKIRRKKKRKRSRRR